MIDIGQYFWLAGTPIPDCDSCEGKIKNKAAHKIYTQKSGIRLCGDCLEILKGKLK